MVPLLAESSQERQRWAHRLALSEVPVVSVGSDGTAAALSTHPGSGLAGTPGSGKGVSSTTLAQDERPGDRDRATQPGSEREPVSQDWDEDLDEDSSAGAFDPKDLVTVSHVTGGRPPTSHEASELTRRTMCCGIFCPCPLFLLRSRKRNLSL